MPGGKSRDPVARDPPFYSRSDLPWRKGFPRIEELRPSSPRASSLVRGEKTVAKKNATTRSPVRERHRERRRKSVYPREKEGKREIVKGRGSIEMTLEKKETEKRWRTVTPDIGTDTKSLIWPVGLFPAGRRNPFRPRVPCRYSPPLLCVLSGSVRKEKKNKKEKRNTATPYTPLHSPLSLRASYPGGKENTPHCHIGD